VIASNGNDGNDVQRKERAKMASSMTASSHDGTHAAALFIAEEGGCLPFIFAGSLLARAVVSGLQGDSELAAQHFHTAM
jgi:hypothetical protein